MISRRAAAARNDPVPFNYSSDFMQSMFSMAGLPTHRDTLHPLDIPVQPYAHVLSPASSGPSSPGTEYPFDLDLDLGVQMEIRCTFVECNRY
ncbi:hypothetical protein C0992_007952 [Termitomyces sp. T32_za158]|nr:hypothetical protein C0992_007952 [Termitomyces sp. T32_za158]